MLVKPATVFNRGYLAPVITAFAAAIAPAQSCIFKRTLASKAFATSIVNLLEPCTPGTAAKLVFAALISRII